MINSIKHNCQVKRKANNFLGMKQNQTNEKIDVAKK